MPEQKERPILFSTDMVRAILDGRKNQTRRVIKPQPEFEGGTEFGGVWTHPMIDDFWIDPESMALSIFESDDVLCPYGYAYADGSGDLLYVRETFCQFAHKPVGMPIKTDFAYKADDEFMDQKWKPSIHMPKKAARIWLKVKDIQVERVQDISEEDALLDGGWLYKNCPFHKNPIKSFEHLWNSINEKRGFGWEENPWVWVVEFEVLSTNGRPG